MRDGLRVARLLLAALGVAVVCAAPAQAYVYWTVGGAAFGSTGGTTIGRANLDASGVNHGLVTGAANPLAIAVDGSHIYWSNASTSSIGRADLDGRNANPTWITLQAGYPAGLAVDASHIYWTGNGNWIGRANIDGTGVNPKALNTTPYNGPTGIAVSGGKIYLGVDGAIASVPAAGGSPTMLGSLPPDTLANEMAIANGYLYWASIDIAGPLPAGGISRMQLSGAFPQVPNYISGLYIPSGVATDGTYLYWSDDITGHLNIGRALIGTLGATYVNYSFISEPGGPTGVAVDAGIDPTKTSLSCTPAIVATGSPTTCTATVTDSASSDVPTGSINVTGNGAAFFSGNPCSLTPNSAGGASCVVGAVPTTSGVQGFHAAYGGDPVHSPSAGDTSICAGTALQCGTFTPPPPPMNTPPAKPKCVVPKLKGKTLVKARKLLSAAHCALGKVTKPHARKHHKLPPLVVGSQSPRSGRRLANGAKVAVTLVKAPSRPKRR